MKIFEVITVSEYGGAQTVVAELVKNFSPDNQIYLLYGGEGEAWSTLGDNFTRIRLGKHDKSISIRDFFLFLKLIYYRIKYKPDIIHLHSSKMGVLGRLAFNKKKSVLTLHGFDSVRKAFKKFLLIEKALKNRAHTIVAVSQYDVRCLAEENIKNNVLCIYNGIEDCMKISEQPPLPIAEKLNSIKGRYSKVLMSISRISKQKKFELFQELAEHYPQYAFVWIGNKEPLENLPENLFCLGEIHNAYNCLPYADLFLLPSNYEGLPISLLEALCFGKPAIASSVGGIPEILNGQNGFAVENTMTAFCEKIDYIFSDSNIYHCLSRNARKSFEDSFTIDKMISAYKQLWNTIISQQK